MKTKLIIILSVIIAMTSCEKQSSDILDFPENDIENTTLSDFEIALTRDAVYGAYTYAMWKNNLENLYPHNPTMEYLEDLFFNVW